MSVLSNKYRKYVAWEITGTMWLDFWQSPVGSFGLSTFSRVFCLGSNTPTYANCSREVWYIVAVQFGILPPYGLVHCRRTVWWFSSIWMIFEYFNDFRGFEWFSSIWVIFEVLNDFRAFEWFSSIWLIFKHLIDFRAFNWFSSIDWFWNIWLIFEYLNYFRVFELFSSVWIIFECLNNFRVFE